MHYTQPPNLIVFNQVAANRIGKHTLLASLEIFQEMLRQSAADHEGENIGGNRYGAAIASLEELDKIEQWLNILQSPQMKDFAKSGLVIAPSGSSQTP